MFAKKREYGAEQPYSLGILRLRLPGIHYKLEIPDMLQGMILCVVPLSITAIMTQLLGIPFEIAIAFVVINNFLYLLHTSFGDPAVSGWITAGLPLYIAFLMGFPEGEARILALIALQLTLAVVFLSMGIFRGADSLVKKMPNSIKAGILIGAGITSISSQFAAEGRVWSMPITILFGGLFALFMLFSKTAEPLRKRYSAFRYIAQYGIAIPFLIAYALGILIGEVGMPTLQWGFVSFPIKEIINNYTVIGLGMPPLQYFIDAFPLALAAYIIAFGDVLVIDSLFKTAQKARPDEKVVFSPRRNNLICGIRNALQGLFSPIIGMAGPSWTAGQVLVINRYINTDRKGMDSYWGGATSIYWGMSFAMMSLPIVSLLKPGLNVGMAITLLIQGYLCGYLAIEILSKGSNLERGVAVIIGSILAIKGAAWGLGIGFVLYLLLQKQWVKQRSTDVDDIKNTPECDKPLEVN